MKDVFRKAGGEKYRAGGTGPTGQNYAGLGEKSAGQLLTETDEFWVGSKVTSLGEKVRALEAQRRLARSWYREEMSRQNNSQTSELEEIVNWKIPALEAPPVDVKAEDVALLKKEIKEGLDFLIPGAGRMTLDEVRDSWEGNILPRVLPRDSGATFDLRDNFAGKTFDFLANLEEARRLGILGKKESLLANLTIKWLFSGGKDANPYLDRDADNRPAQEQYVHRVLMGTSKVPRQKKFEKLAQVVSEKNLWIMGGIGLLILFQLLLGVKYDQLAKDGGESFRHYGNKAIGWVIDLGLALDTGPGGEENVIDYPTGERFGRWHGYLRSSGSSAIYKLAMDDPHIRSKFSSEYPDVLVSYPTVIEALFETGKFKDAGEIPDKWKEFLDQKKEIVRISRSEVMDRNYDNLFYWNKDGPQVPKSLYKEASRDGGYIWGLFVDEKTQEKYVRTLAYISPDKNLRILNDGLVTNNDGDLYWRVKALTPDEKGYEKFLYRLNPEKMDEVQVELPDALVVGDLPDGRPDIAKFTAFQKYYLPSGEEANRPLYQKQNDSVKVHEGNRVVSTQFFGIDTRSGFPRVKVVGSTGPGGNRGMEIYVAFDHNLQKDVLGISGPMLKVAGYPDSVKAIFFDLEESSQSAALYQNYSQGNDVGAFDILRVVRRDFPDIVVTEMGGRGENVLFKTGDRDSRSYLGFNNTQYVLKGSNDEKTRRMEFVMQTADTEKDEVLGLSRGGGVNDQVAVK